MNFDEAVKRWAAERLGPIGYSKGPDKDGIVRFRGVDDPDATPTYLDWTQIESVEFDYDNGGTCVEGTCDYPAELHVEIHLKPVPQPSRKFTVHSEFGDVLNELLATAQEGEPE